MGFIIIQRCLIMNGKFKCPKLLSPQSSMSQLVFSRSWKPKKTGSNIREGMYVLVSQEQKANVSSFHVVFI